MAISAGTFTETSALTPADRVEGVALVSPGPGLRMSVDESAGHIAVSFHGDVDLEDAARVEEALHDAVTRCEAGVSVDLSDVTFLGSTGVRLLLAAGEQAKRRGGRFSFVLGDGPARRVIDLLGLREALDVLDP